MGNRKCAVPSCSYKHRKNDPEKRSMFQCPKDEQKARLWASYIPGLENLLTSQRICEKHFDPRYIRRYIENHSAIQRSRLSSDAVPTIFDFDVNHYSASNLFSNNIINIHETSNIFLRNNKIDHIQPPNTETSLKDVVQDLSASEQVLMNIKKEMLEEEISKIKIENLEDCSQKVKEEMDIQINETSVYEQLQNDYNHYTTILPESWSISQLPLGNDRVFVISKECTVSENDALVVMYEKNIVLDRNGNLHYSIHGKRINPGQLHPSVLKDVKLLLDIIIKFNEEKICQGICTSEFEVDKDCATYADDLGYRRHINCTLVADTEQCNFCYEYSQYLLSMLVNNDLVLNNETVNLYNQIYYT